MEVYYVSWQSRILLPYWRHKAKAIGTKLHLPSKLFLLPYPKSQTNKDKSDNKVDNNSYSNNNNPCADSEDNNDNIKDGNFISISTPNSSDSNADNAPPGRNKMNNTKHIPSFICHPNRIVLRVLNQKRSSIQLCHLRVWLNHQWSGKLISLPYW